jgi:tryptophan halogenase
MTAPPIRKIVIVGGGTAGWMTAAALARILGGMPDLSIDLVESDAIGTVGVGEATIPPIVLFNQMLGIDEAEFVRETNATYKLGIEFVDWTRLGHRFVHPFGRFGTDMMGIDFHHHWLRARTTGDVGALDEYSISAVAGRQGRFLRPRPDLPQSPYSRLAYAFQFDASLYARYLRRRAERDGVRRVEGRILRAHRDPANGHVAAVVLDDGREVAGELFIDCSGFRALLIGETMGASFDDWRHLLPCDRAWAVPCASVGEPRPLTRATARAAGWQWRIPLQHRTGNGHVYSSAHMSDDEAAAILLDNLDGAPLGDPRPLRFAAGMRRQAWIGNVVAIGLASGFLEPLESTSIHLVQSAISRLLALFPDNGFNQPGIDRYNALTAREYHDIRALLILHYRGTQRDDSPFWRDCQAITPPPELAEKLALFRANGHVLREQHELFSETSWLAVMIGKGIEPAGYHPIAAMLPPDETARHVAHIRGVVAKAAASMPTQRAFLHDQGSLADALAGAA